MANWYVDGVGPNSNDGTIAHPKATIGAALALMGNGDTLNVKAGVTFNESVFLTIPSGTSLSARTVIQKWGAFSDPNPIMRGSLTLALENYIMWDGIDIDSINENDTTDNVLINSGTGITIKNSELVNAQRHGVLTGDANGAPLSDILFLNLNVHNSGQGYLTSGDPRHHNFYIAASHFPVGSIIIDGCESHNEGNPANTGVGGPSGSAANSWGIQVYSAVPGYLRNVIVRNCFVHDNNNGIVAGSGNNHLIYNNLVYNNGLHGDGEGAITIGYGNVDGVKVYNNTIVGNSGNSAPAVLIGNFGSVSNTDVVNNIFWQNGVNNIVSGVGDDHTGTHATNFTSDPHFIQPGSDFHLDVGSPCFSAGNNLFSVFQTDKDGHARPSSTAWAIGAYESGSGDEGGGGISGGGTDGGGGTGGGTGTPPGGSPPTAFSQSGFWFGVLGDQLTVDELLQHECFFTVATPTVTSGCPLDTLLVKNLAFSFQATASGGTSPYFWSLSGAPPGISINSSTGLISGTPSVTGDYVMIINAQDAGGTNATVTCNVTVHNSLILRPTVVEEYEDNPPVNPARSNWDDGAKAIDLAKGDMTTAAIGYFKSSTSTAAGYASLLLSGFGPQPPAQVPASLKFHAIVDYHVAPNGGPHHATSVFNIRNPNPIGFASLDGIVIGIDIDNKDQDFGLPPSGPFNTDLTVRECVSVSRAGSTWATDFSSLASNIWFRSEQTDTGNYTLNSPYSQYKVYDAWSEIFY